MFFFFGGNSSTLSKAGKHSTLAKHTPKHAPHFYVFLLEERGAKHTPETPRNIPAKQTPETTLLVLEHQKETHAYEYFTNMAPLPHLQP